MGIGLDALVVGDPADTWTAAGFLVDAHGRCSVDGVRLRMVGRDSGAGLLGWALSGLPAGGAHIADVDGIPTARATPPPGTTPPRHPNGAIGIDHVVVFTPHLARTVAALADLGVAARRERDAELGGSPIRQVFFRFGAVVVEVVGTPGAEGEGPASLWGVTFTTADLDATVAFFGPRTSRAKDAVQPGRRITTVRHREFGMSVRVAFLSAGR